MLRASTGLFVAAVAVSAAMAIVAARRDDRSGYALFKPLTTLIILLGAAFLILPAQPIYRSVIVLGLGLSLAGDLLLLESRRFAAGLVAFLLAQLAYLTAFSLGSPVRPGQLVWVLPFALAGGAVAAFVWGGLARMRIPALLYVAVAAVMAWRAATRLAVPAIPHSSAFLAAAGALLFMASDAVLAVRRFRKPFAGAQTLELTLYWTGQALIALSVRSV